MTANLANGTLQSTLDLVSTVQLTEKGKAGFDEQLNELAGPDGRGKITGLMNDGLICAVKWDKNPYEEHFYRTGKIRGSKSVL